MELIGMIIIFVLGALVGGVLGYYLQKRHHEHMEDLMARNLEYLTFKVDEYSRIIEGFSEED